MNKPHPSPQPPGAYQKTIIVVRAKLIQDTGSPAPDSRLLAEYRNLLARYRGQLFLMFGMTGEMGDSGIQNEYPYLLQLDPSQSITAVPRVVEKILEWPSKK